MKKKVTLKFILKDHYLNSYLSGTVMLSCIYPLGAAHTLNLKCDKALEVIPKPVVAINVEMGEVPLGYMGLKDNACSR